MDDDQLASLVFATRCALASRSGAACAVRSNKKRISRILAELEALLRDGSVRSDRAKSRKPVVLTAWELD